MKLKKCKICDKEIEKKSNISVFNYINKKKYCSKKCSNKALTFDRPNRKTGIYIECKFCNNEFYKHQFNINSKFCSTKCRDAYKIGKKYSKETREKMRKAHLGNKSFLWKGGKTKLQGLIRGCFKYRLWRCDVFTRDNYICQECGQRGGKLNAHHRKAFAEIIEEYNIVTIEEALNCEKLWNINNGQTLCVDCHKLTDNYGSKFNLAK